MSTLAEEFPASATGAYAGKAGDLQVSKLSNGMTVRASAGFGPCRAGAAVAARRSFFGPRVAPQTWPGRVLARCDAECPAAFCP